MRFEVEVHPDSQAIRVPYIRSYEVTVEDEEIILTSAEDDYEYHFAYEDFQSAEFRIGDGDLWMKNIINGESLLITGDKKAWKREAALVMIARINDKCKVINFRNYERFTRSLWPFS